MHTVDFQNWLRRIDEFTSSQREQATERLKTDHRGKLKLFA